MSSVLDRNAVYEALEAEDEASNGDFVSELHYESVGNEVEFVNSKMPEGWTIHVREVNTETEYDSYGARYTKEDAYVILDVSDGMDSALYRIPGSYDSYNYWQWDLSAIMRVEKREKLVKSWEWSNVES